MSHDHDHASSPFLRRSVIACASAAMLSLAAAAAGRIMGPTSSVPPSSPVLSRDLLFRDRADGAVVVYDATNLAAPIDVVAPATNGFLRATMRGLARQRLRQDADREIPFRLTAWADGRLTLEDPTTGRKVEMEAFGRDNEQVFANLLTAKAGS
jgi:putative photosynthetic complex assembly protein